MPQHIPILDSMAEVGFPECTWFDLLYQWQVLAKVALSWLLEGKSLRVLGHCQQKVIAFAFSVVWADLEAGISSAYVL